MRKIITSLAVLLLVSACTETKPADNMSGGMMKGEMHCNCQEMRKDGKMMDGSSKEAMQCKHMKGKSTPAKKTPAVSKSVPADDHNAHH